MTAADLCTKGLRGEVAQTMPGVLGRDHRGSDSGLRHAGWADREVSNQGA